jgi:hypothetical protein
MIEFSPDNTRLVIKLAPGFAVSEDGSCFLYKGCSGVVFHVWEVGKSHLRTMDSQDIGDTSWRYYNLIDRIMVTSWTRRNIGSLGGREDDRVAIRISSFRFLGAVGCWPIIRCV